MNRVTKGGVVVLAFSLSACLPADQDVVPKGAIFAAVVAEPATVAGSPIVTDDGWSITVERILTTVTLTARSDEMSYTRGNCFAYDLGSPLVDLRVGYTLEARALDAIQCSIWVGSGYGVVDALGPGVTEQDAAPFRSIRNSPGPKGDFSSGFSTTPPQFRIAGTARREGTTTKTFDLYLTGSYSYVTSYRERYLPVQVRSADRVLVDFTFSTSQLFRTTLTKDAGPLRFDALAYADDKGDADGVISQDELKALTLSAVSEDLGIPYTVQDDHNPNSELPFDLYLSSQISLAWSAALH